MAITLPTLDDVSWAELLAEARAQLPALAPEWTNHNPSDPGITLLELFAWLTEMLVWRTNQLSPQTTAAFLRLLNGPGWRPGPDPDTDLRATLAGLRETWRAVTPADYEALATGAFNREAASLPGVSRIARARCVPRRWLGAGDAAGRAADAPGRVTLLVVPERESPAALPVAGDATLWALAAFLDERRLLGTRVSVLPPVYVPVRVEVLLVRRPDVPDPAPPGDFADGWEAVAPGDLRRRVLEALAGWLDPLAGGADEGGWPFGGDVHASDLYARLEAVSGVDHVAALRLSSTCADGQAGCETADKVLHPETGEQVGLALAAHQLPAFASVAADVRVAAAVLPVRVLVSLVPAAGVEADAVARGVAVAVRAVLGPFGGGPDGGAAATVPAGAVAAAVLARAIARPDLPIDVRFEADPARLQGQGAAQAVRFEAGEAALAQAVLYLDGRKLWA